MPKGLIILPKWRKIAASGHNTVIGSSVQLLWGVAIGCNSGGDWPIADVTVEQAGSIALKATNGYAGAMTW